MSTKGSNKVSQKKGNNKANGSVIQKSNTRAAGNRGVTRSCGFMRCKRSEFSPVSSSSGRSKPLVTPADSHRNAAIEDCIEFINSSASLPRSNSVSANSH
ncbi:hypothetical protein CRYUN_Cryun11dG0122800 [Craigia yunnanensis]